MEQQKILWIILSVAVLLLVVLGTALFVFGPASSGSYQGQDSSLASGDSAGFDPVEWARNGSDYPDVSEEAAEKPEDSEFVVVYGEDLPKDELAPAGTESGDVDTSGTVVSIEVEKKEPEAPVPAPRPAPTPAPVVKKAPAPKAAPAPAPKKMVPEYWIQAGSFTSMTRAEEARNALSGKGFPATIQTKNVDGKDYYRVRVGSYSTKAEAEKFLYWVKDIDGFTQSYVSQVQVLR